MFYSKSPWEARAFAVACSDNFMPLLLFRHIAWGQASLILSAFCFGHVTQPTALRPPPLLQRYFVRKGAWSSANPNRDLPVYPLSALTLAGVAFLQGASIWAPQS